MCIRSETVATLLSNNFECLHENRGKSCILQPRKLYEPLFLRLYLRYQIKIHETENIFRKFYRETTYLTTTCAKQLGLKDPAKIL